VFFLALLAGASLSVHNSNAKRQEVAEQEQASMQRRADMVASLIEERTQAHIQVLKGVTALFAMGPISHAKFDEYISRIDVRERYPGVVGIGFAPLVGSADLSSHVKSVQADGLPDYTVTPPGDRKLHVPVSYATLFAGTPNRVLGFDMYSDPARRDSIDKTISSDLPQATSPLRLRQDTARDSLGFLVFLPVTSQAAPDTVSGIVVGSFRLSDFMANILERQDRSFAYSVRDTAHAESPMFTSGSPSQCIGVPAHASAHVAGRVWEVQICELSSLRAQTDATQASMVLFYSLAVALLVALFMSMLVSLRENANNMALRMSAAFRESESRLRDIADNVPAMIAYLKPDLHYGFTNAKYRQWLGWTGEDAESPIQEMFGELEGGHSDNLLPYKKRCLSGETVQFENILPNGQVFDTIYVPHTQDGKVVGMYALASDVSTRKQIEEHLFEEKERARTTLDAIADAVIACDRDRRITHMNPVACEMTGWPLAEALGLVLDRVVDLIDFDDGHSQLKKFHIEDSIASHKSQNPLGVRRPDGSICTVDASSAPIHDRDGNLTGGVLVFRDISHANELAAKMTHLAHHDALTDLPNRVLLQSLLEDALRDEVRPGFCPEGALVLIDLDHFKDINETLGHPSGDRVLREVSHRLLAAVDHRCTVSRQGGDEFVILLPGFSDADEVLELCERLGNIIAAPIVGENSDLHVSASMGLTMYPQDGRDAGTLMKNVDIALYNAKHTGRRCVSRFLPEMGEKAESRIHVELGLRRALKNGNELFLVYQPRVRRPDNKIVGMEALVRWRQPDGTVVFPTDFIGVAENSGLISSLDAWVMGEACRQAMEWRSLGLAGITVSVNVSVAGFDPDAIIDNVRSALDDSGLPANALEIEFTETQMFANPDRARQIIDQLKLLGLHVAIDDFGMGYSNLGYLAQYRFDTLKIDRSFIIDLTSDDRQQAIVKAIIAIGRALGCRIVAEGVETQEQQDILDTHGPHEVQGYLHAKPMDASTATVLLGIGYVNL
jgi:diguanylate cyclase (GGDEF)-like protein/PAS domain S-box-containing protein